MTRSRGRLLLVLLIVAAHAALVAQPAGARQPDVVVILTDDQRADTLWAMPHVRDLAKQGVRFANAFVPVSMCCPSRTSLLTGRYSHSTGIWGNRIPFGGFHVFDDSDTLATRLDDAGYQTALIGKYLHQYDGSRVPPGWDRWFAFVHGGDYYRYYALDQHRLVHFGSRRADYATDVLARKAESFIAGADPESPMFLYLTPFAPHYPAIPAERDLGAFDRIEPWRPPSYDERDISDKPRWVRRRPPIDRAAIDLFRQQQLESLLAVDDLVQGVVDALRDAGRLSNTLLVFTSDNAVAWGEHRLSAKDAPYDAASHVPLVVRWGGAFPPGTVNRGVVAANVDVAATILEAAGVATDGIEGVSLLQGRSSVLTEAIKQAGHPGYCGVRTRWRLYVGYLDGEEELYNLRRDPWELRNRAGKEGPDLARLRALADASCGGLIPTQAGGYGVR